MGSANRGVVKKRTIWLFLMFSLLYAGIVGRLVYVQLYRGADYRKWADCIRIRDIAIPASRGCIYDRGGRVLALSIESASVYANRNEVKDVPATAVQVAAVLGKDPHDIQAELDRQRTIVWLGRQLDPRIADKVFQLQTKLPGIGIQRDAKRVYPAGKLAAQVLGFTNAENSGLEGEERVLDSLMRGRDGMTRAELDARRRVIPETRHTVRQPENGRDVFLTIDVTIQNLAEQALAKMAQKYHPQSASAIVMDPHTGEIIALANYPTYDPNSPQSAASSVWRNRAVADLYEPGSTMKLLTIAAGLNEGLSPHAVYACCTGHEKMAGGRIPCTLHHPFEAGHGAVDMYKIIRYSCNIGAAHVALRLGADKLRRYEQAFGLLKKTSAGFGCEAVGRMEPAKDWRPIRLANIGFGQGIAVTPLQMASMYSAVANGGVYVPPQVVREVRSADGTVVQGFAPRHAHRVISKAAATELTRMLVGCVEDGTGKPAQIKGRTVAGKTGSAQVPRAGGGGYESGTFIASFMGFAPASNPRLVIAVVVNKPQGSHWGATVAAPVFQEIGEKALWYLRVPTDAPVEPEQPKRRQGGDARRTA